ncbi:hypothetical protein [Gorillibacterium sp. CAU 1737]|uniref:hypothetical protein n=1 Tax=Gorillibacterium sp. CAU 1737 TaxID=3140362 RepID=UPI00325FF1A7
MDIKSAYERVNANEQTPQEELDRAFELVLKRERTARAGSNAEALAEVEKDIEAYRTILDYRSKQAVNAVEEERLKKFGKLSGTVSRTEDFFRLNRTRLMIGIISVAVLVIVGAFTWNVVDERRKEAALPPVDLSIMFLGAFQADDQAQESKVVEEAILKQFPEWKRVKVRVLYLPTSSSGGMDQAYMTKAMAELMSEYPDVLLLDKSSIKWMAGQDSLADLSHSHFTKAYEAAKGNQRVVNAINNQTQEDLPYGIDFTKTTFAKSLSMQYLEMVAAVNPNVEDQEKLAKMEAFLSKAAEAE